ncbi:unnamed protein product [Trichogramma brassicae]|uniref:Uncharacterized protein n=1 Tax=Trichogramma brassicae TaxID=86971 RepID=A0A6H5J2C2_9HYME|nr:unnamed protein product [Trichogramma brassicae]
MKLFSNILQNPLYILVTKKLWRFQRRARRMVSSRQNIWSSEITLKRCGYSRGVFAALGRCRRRGRVAKRSGQGTTASPTLQTRRDVSTPLRAIDPHLDRRAIELHCHLSELRLQRATSRAFGRLDGRAPTMFALLNLIGE